MKECANLLIKRYLVFLENNKTEDNSPDANEQKFKESKLLYKIMLFKYTFTIIIIPSIYVF